jgi:YD repeat-containing protein
MPHQTGLADDFGDFGEGVVEDVMEDERHAFGRRHRLQYDEEGHVHRLAKVTRSAGSADSAPPPPAGPLIHSVRSGSGSGIHAPT